MVKISVIIPVYNSGEYLKQCLDSILSQSYIDFEIICIDDFSSDNSLDILQEYSLKDSRITIIRNPYNIGAARSRNIGIQLARGEYIIILDSDDWYVPNFFKLMMEKAETLSADLVICNSYRIDNVTGKNLGNYFYIEKFALDKMNGLLDKEFFNDRLLNLFNVTPWNKMVRKEFVVEHQIYFQDLPNCNDIYWSNILLVMVEKIAYIDEKLIFKRENTVVQISSSRGKKPICSFLAVQKIINKLMELGVYDKYRTSYEIMALGTLNYAISHIVNKTERECFIKDLLDKYLIKINMKDCLCVNKNNTALTSKDIFSEAIQVLKRNNLKYALWGYGNFGKNFASKCNEFGLKLAEIYDSDTEKQGITSSGVPIMNYPGNGADVIIINNYNIIEHVKEAIKRYNKKQKIILVYGNLVRWEGEKSIIEIDCL
jgi:glycosyltransferase involved in cell wall biosynthesis